MEYNSVLPKISVIVPVYNHWHLIPNLLNCLEKQSLNVEKFEILLIDNGSSNVPNIGALPSNVKFLQCMKPGSYAARNMGVNHAKGELLAFTDADCQPTSDWLTNALARYKENGMMLISGGVQIIPVDWTNMTVSEMHEVALGIPQESYAKKGYGATANLFIPRVLFEKYGLFDEKRFSGGDGEFCRRVARSGIVLLYCRDALVNHPARREWHELVAKKCRIKGGQLTVGTKKQRLTWIFRTLVPPVYRWKKIFLSSKLLTSQKFLVCWVEVKLWLVEMGEMLRLFIGYKPRR